MSIVQISKIQVRSGNIADLPQLAVGEFGWAVDEQRLFIGNDPNTIGALPDNTEIATGTGFGKAAGNTGEIQFNTDGEFDASANLTWDNTTAVFTVNGNIDGVNADLSGNVRGFGMISMSGLFLNTAVISEPYEVPPGYNGMSTGPIEIVPGGSITILAGRWVVL